MVGSTGSCPFSKSNSMNWVKTVAATLVVDKASSSTSPASTRLGFPAPCSSDRISFRHFTRLSRTGLFLWMSGSSVSGWTAVRTLYSEPRWRSDRQTAAILDMRNTLPPKLWTSLINSKDIYTQRDSIRHYWQVRFFLFVGDFFAEGPVTITTSICKQRSTSSEQVN